MTTPNIQRAEEAYELRCRQAKFQKNLPLPSHPANGDEDRYATKAASFSKGLPHNELGEVDISAYDKMLYALQSGQPADFENIPMGEPNLAQRRKLVNPQSGLAFDYAGADSQHLSQPPAPLFSSPEQAGEMVENYWMALTRDIPFTEYDANSLTQAAVQDLNRLSDFRGPKIGGQVTTGSLFRGLTPGDLMGPYLSQFLLKAAKFGSEIIDQRIQTTQAGQDYMTAYADWLQVQRGTQQPDNIFDPVLRYIRNGRDSSQYVHIDVLFQGYFDACLILAAPVTNDLATSGYGAPYNPGNPYVHSLTQEGFGTFGPPHIKGLLGEIAVRALKAVWYQKWLVHRRLRPEVFGGRIHNHKIGAASYPIHADALNSDALQRIYNNSGQTSYLLPMAFTEGSPLHPSYGAGHATVAGACVTILKWFFDESFPIESPMEADPGSDGTTLRPYVGVDKDQLTVGGELNKLASNIGISRNISGVHWRSDLAQSLLLGEEVAIRTLIDFRETVSEDFDGGTFTKFDGTVVTV